MAARRGRRVTAPVEEVEELEVVEEETADDLEDLEVEEPEELEEAPAPRKRAAKKAPAKAAAKPAKAEPAAESSGYDTNWLVEHVNETLDTDHDSRSIRMVLRRLARDGELTREIGVDRGRWEFPKGANDPGVKKIIRAIQNGAVKEEKTVQVEKAQAAPAKKTAKAPAKKAPAKATRRRTAVVEDDEE